ncbi:hypothetical protein ABTZ99_08815 [Actinosynnema sp. NPDC002837]
MSTAVAHRSNAGGAVFVAFGGPGSATVLGAPGAAPTVKPHTS